MTRASTNRRAAVNPKAVIAAIGSGLLMGAGLMLSGCISVKAPDKPIVIELNINIKQEVVYRLSRDAGGTVENNPEIF